MSQSYIPLAPKSVAGAFGKQRWKGPGGSAPIHLPPRPPSEEELAAWKAQVARTRDPSRKKGNGAPYHALGQSIKDLSEARAETLKEFHERLVWFPPSAFMVLSFKQLLRSLWRIDFENFTSFLGSIGLTSETDIVDLDGMNAISFLELCDEVISRIPHETLVECGWEDAGLQRALARDRLKKRGA